MADRDLTAQRLREFLHYEPETGQFTRLKAWRGRGVIGDPVGIKHNRGYLTIKLVGGRYLAHRLAWFYMTGTWPAHGIDHRNRVKSDNRFANLRDVPQTLNMQNRAPAAGVTWCARERRWRAQISANRVHYNLGAFVSREEARRCYESARERLHGAAGETGPLNPS